MKLIPWRERSPLATLRSDLDTWIDEFFRSPGTMHVPEALQPMVVPPVNLAQTDKEFTATIELPGLEEKDVQVQILGDQLVVGGERKWEEEQKGKEFYRVESQYGSFRRVLELPDGLALDPERIAATFAKGVLEIRIPKLEPRPAKRIRIQAK